MNNQNNPYEKNIPSKCAVCNSDVLIDQLGHGLCPICGWHQSIDGIDFPNKVRYPNVISFNKALLLYRKGSPLKASFEDFIEGLYFYSEMHFEYHSRSFGVCLRTKNHLIEFYENAVSESLQKFITKEEFFNYANIDGILLKGIWDDVENAYYMVCG
ncbi:MAG: hypothetical protein PHE93_05310 [Clostridia bacterium]|nr:hypothetical protein [Clostridia bacterium]